MAEKSSVVSSLKSMFEVVSTRVSTCLNFGFSTIPGVEISTAVVSYQILQWFESQLSTGIPSLRDDFFQIYQFYAIWVAKIAGRGKSRKLSIRVPGWPMAFYHSIETYTIIALVGKCATTPQRHITYYVTKPPRAS